MGHQARRTPRARSNPWAAEPEQVGETPELEEAEDSGEDLSPRGDEDGASRSGNPSGGSVGSPGVPHEEDLQEVSSSGDEDAFRVARSRRIVEGEEEEGSGNRGGRREPRTKAFHDRNASAGRDAPREDAGGPQEEARASVPQPPKGKKRVWKAADE